MLSMISPMALFWLVALIIFCVTEAATVGLVSIWFAAGALAALIAAAVDGPIWLQIGLFLVISVVMLASLRPIVRKMSATTREKTNVDRHIGRAALVTEEINNLAETGAVRLDGVTWTARSEDGSVIPEGTVIVVQRIAGVKVYVVPQETPAGVS